MSSPTKGVEGNQTATSLVLWTLLAVYSVARVLQIFPKVPMVGVVALNVLPPILFAFVHGSAFYRVRGILAFFVFCLVIANILENLSVRTGFPFGHYNFTDRMGPKLFAVPIFLGLAYVGMAYLSWTLARLIVGNMRSSLAGAGVIIVPLVAAFIMVAWDFSQDPVWATILHLWNWVQGGPYFGVPVSNFLGWYLTVYLIYQSFALYLRNHPIDPSPMVSRYWQMAVLFYAVSAVGNVLLVIPQTGISVVSDPTGVRWRVSDITGTCALVSIFVMGAFALMAWASIVDQRSQP
jgi:uncharacterized membrane protein